MNCVVAAQGERLGELAGLACELYVDADERQFAMQQLEVFERARVRGGGEPGTAPCGRERIRVSSLMLDCSTSIRSRTTQGHPPKV